jgi:hypothetical protein
MVLLVDFDRGQVLAQLRGSGLRMLWSRRLEESVMLAVPAPNA